MKPIRILTLIIALSACVAASAQNASDLRINEVMVFNDSSVVDDYGNHVGWIEIYNTSYNTVNLSGLFLTDDMGNPTKSRIAKSPDATIAPRSYFILYATGDKSVGVHHLTFNLKNSRMIALFDGNGRTIIDSVALPAMTANMSLSRETDGGEVWTTKNLPTPNSSNWFEPFAGEVDQFKSLDPFGAGMAMIAMTIVLSSLATLYCCFKIVGKIATRKKKEKPFVAKNAETGEEASNEVNAAIALALFLLSKQEHDDEYTVLTMHKVSRNYSPWSSKIYGLRKRPGGISSF